jgi:hypothetical protein
VRALFLGAYDARLLRSFNDNHEQFHDHYDVAEG